jgi:hypothetical protein
LQSAGCSAKRVPWQPARVAQLSSSPANDYGSFDLRQEA